MVSPYTDIVVPVDGQPARASTFGVPVRDSILLLDERLGQAEVEQQRVLKRGRRTTSKTAITTTELGIIRVDDVPVVSGYMYRISTSGANADPTSASISAPTTTTGEVFSFVCRAEFSASPGAPATVSSTSLGRTRFAVNSISQGPIQPVSCFYYAATTGYLSVWLGGLRQEGSGTYQVFADASNPVDLTVEYAGIDPGDTGVIL